MLPDTYQSAAALRALASWYREYAERASNPAIWSSRLSTAEELEQRASAHGRLGSPLVTATATKIGDRIFKIGQKSAAEMTFGTPHSSAPGNRDQRVPSRRG